MPKYLYHRQKNIVERVVRCYLTLNCNANCEYCSAGINEITPERKKIWIPAEEWAEGINAKNRYTILAGGEPFLYPEFAKLYSMLNPTFKVEVYINLQADISDFLALNNKRPSNFLVSLHPSVKDREVWNDQVQELIKQGFPVRFHIVKSEGWEERRQFLIDKGYAGAQRITCCDDQRVGVKSTNNLYQGQVRCKHQIYLYGPDGYRYHCVKYMGLDVRQVDHISLKDDDSDNWTVRRCYLFGDCTGCDNNIIGSVEKIINGQR